MGLRDYLRCFGSSDLRDGRNLTHDEAYQAFSIVLDAGENEILLGAFLVSLRWKGVTVEELTGFARAARERAHMPCRGQGGVVYMCPPQDGYDRFPPLELSAGLIASAAGARVVLVVDRHVPPRRGLTAADALSHLGLEASWTPARVEEEVERTGFGVVAFSAILPAWLGLRRVRRDLGIRTPLSTVEKLVAPESAAVVLGAQHGPVLGIAVETMAGLGHPSGIAVQGVEGGIVPTLVRRTRGVELSGKHQTPLTVEPADFGLSAEADPELPMFGPPDEGQGTSDNPVLVEASGKAVEGVLRGGTGSARNASLLGAAIVLKAAGRCPTLAEGVDLATSALDSGGAWEVLERLRERSRS